MTETKKTLVLERMLKAAPEKVWKMWTTKDGLEKWWSPEGFSAEVLHLDVRVGGRFEIVMEAVQPEIVRFLESIGVPPRNVAKGNYVEIEPHQRIAYDAVIDFVKGVTPYSARTVVRFTAVGSGTKLVVENGWMHDDNWTDMARQGWEQQLGKLERLFG